MNTETRGTLLVVDDDGMNRELLSRRLRREGFEVLVADGARDALTQMMRQRVDMVLLDVMMPQIDGFDTLRMLRRRYSRLDLPVMMVSARSSTEDMLEALSLGANDYATKPIDFPVLLARIEAHMGVVRRDPLTGLPDRAIFTAQLDANLEQARRKNQQVAVIAIDLDFFKLINDTRGHDAGDTLLRQVARRLSDILGPERPVSRLGGDEFLAQIPEIDGITGVTSVVEGIVGALYEPFHLGESELELTASLGIAIYPGDGQTSAELLSNADTAMWRAKRQRNAYRFYEAASNEDLLERRARAGTDPVDRATA